MLKKHFGDNWNEKSVAARLRRQRFQLFVGMLDKVAPVAHVLDVGGTQRYWEIVTAGSEILDKVQVTILNMEPQMTSLPNFTSTIGDARAMPQYVNGQFDLVFSNSTIEHVGSLTDQRNMAKEVVRVGKGYYVQTPNRYFPIEPHFLFPCFQFLPVSLRVWLVQNFNVGHFRKTPEPQKALSLVTSVRLMTRDEVRALFNNAVIVDEKYLGLTKSFVAYCAEKGVGKVASDAV